jgi:hypothetical protein
VFLIKNKIFFIKRKGKWLNTRLEVMANGGGIKGIFKFVLGLFKCCMGKHSYVSVFSLKTMLTEKECHFCRKKSNEY